MYKHLNSAGGELTPFGLQEELGFKFPYFYLHKKIYIPKRSQKIFLILILM